MNPTPTSEYLEEAERLLKKCAETTKLKGLGGIYSLFSVLYNEHSKDNPDMHVVYPAFFDEEVVFVFLQSPKEALAGAVDLTSNLPIEEDGPCLEMTLTSIYPPSYEELKEWMYK